MTQLHITLSMPSHDETRAKALLRRLLARTCFRDVEITTRKVG